MRRYAFDGLSAACCAGVDGVVFLSFRLFLSSFCATDYFSAGKRIRWIINHLDSCCL